MMRHLLIKAVAFMVATALVLGPHMVLANPPCEAASSLQKGMEAPCTGLLLPEPQARQALLCLSVDLPKLHIEFDKLKLKLFVETQSFKELVAVERTRANKLQALLDEAITIPKLEVAWYESPYFWGVVGVVVGSALTFGAVYAATELGK